MFGSSKHQLHQKKEYEFLQINPSKQTKGNLVFIHGMFGGLSNFDPLIERIDDYSIFVPSIPLYDLKKSQLTIPDLAEWFHRFIEMMDLNDVILLGNSMGGHIGLQYAHRYIENVRALVLTGSSGLMENDFGSTFPRRKSRDYIRERANMTFYEDLADDVIVDEILEVANSKSKLLSLLKLTRSTHTHSVEEYLPNIHQPTQLIWGKQDIVTPPKVANKFLALMPNARLDWIDKCGHAPMMERPEQFASIMTSFLNELEQQSQSKSQIV